MAPGGERRDGSVPVVRVREVEEADVPRVVALVTEVLREHGLEFGQGSKTDEELTRLPHAYRDHGGAFWVAVNGRGEIVGTCAAFPVGSGVVELRKMYLVGAARGFGAGALLLSQCIDWARSLGARRLVLDTTEQMRRAIAFYERHGFVRDDAQIRGARCSRGYALDL